MMRKFILLMFVFGIPGTSLAQTDQASWARLSALHPGQKIQVVDMTSKKHSGTFASISDTAIAYRLTSGEQSTPRQDVRTITLMENKHRLRNTFIFAGIGAGAGAGIGAASVQQTGSILLSVSRGKGAAVGAVIGVIAGATVGALLPSHSTIYNVSSH